MENDKQESLWDSLADELGVDADPNANERKQPEATELPSAAKSERPSDPPKAKQGDWNSLADDLGLEIPTEEEPAAAEEFSAEPPSEESGEKESDSFGQSSEQITFDELPELSSSSDQEVEDFSFDESGLDELAEATSARTELDTDLEETSSDIEEEGIESGGISGEAARDAFDALFSDTTSDWELPANNESMFDTPLEFSRLAEEEENSETESSDTDPDAEVAEEETTEKPKRRRRRRRRGRRGGRGDKSEQEDRPEQSDAEDLEESVEDGASIEADTEDSDSEDGEKRERPKRRRRRRGRRGGGEGRKSREAAEGEDKQDSLTANAADDDEDEDDEFGILAGDSGSDDVAGNGSGPSRQRAAHRNLPTWSEAIGCIVDSNLEQRSKAPAKQTSSRGRGRGRGRRKNSNRE